MESKVDCIRGGNVWIGACAIVQRQPKRTGGSGIEERGNKEGKVWCTNYSTHRIRYYAPILHKGRARQMGTKADGTWQQKCSKD